MVRRPTAAQYELLHFCAMFGRQAVDSYSTRTDVRARCRAFGWLDADYWLSARGYLAWATEARRNNDLGNGGEAMALMHIQARAWRDHANWLYWEGRKA